MSFHAFARAVVLDVKRRQRSVTFPLDPPVRNPRLGKAMATINLYYTHWVSLVKFRREGVAVAMSFLCGQDFSPRIARNVAASIIVCLEP